MERLAPIRCGNTTLRFDSRPTIMGILNVTPDSFSDGGKFFEPERAVEHALKQAQAGADILDIGGESTRPGSETISAEEEADRVIPIIERVCKWSTVPISVDTQKSKVAKLALEAGASMVNDISALRFDEELAGVVARAGVPLVVMHMKGSPKTMQAQPIEYRDLMGEIISFLKSAVDRAVLAGVQKERVIVDPGIGFGKTPEHNLTILNRLSALSALGRPVLVGPSRKAFIGKVLNADVGQRLFGTAAAVAAAVFGGAQIIRVHDVGPMREVALLAQAIRTESLSRGLN